MDYYCFVQARYSSRRLKGKVLKKFGDLTLLEVLLKRLKKSKKIKKVIVLTSTSVHDKKIINLCKKIKINYFSGPLKNVFLRFKAAIKKFKPDKVIRICADSPLLDWRLMDKMIGISKKYDTHDIITNVQVRTFPKGQSIEILKPSLFSVSSDLLSNDQKEHVTKFFYKTKSYKIHNLKCKKKFNQLSLCVDDENDYLLISKIISKKGIFSTWKTYAKEL